MVVLAGIGIEQSQSPFFLSGQLPMSRRFDSSSLKLFLDSLRTDKRTCHRAARRKRGKANVASAVKIGGSEALEERVLLAGVNDDPTNPAWQHDIGAVAKDDVLALLHAVETVAVAQTADESVDRSLSAVGKSLNELLTDANGDVVSRESLSLHAGIENYLNGFTYTGGDFPTVHGLAVAVDSAVQPFGGAVDVDLNEITFSSQLDLQIVVQQTLNSQLDLAIETPHSAMEQDLEIAGTATVNVAASFAADLSLNVSLSDIASRPEAFLDWTEWEASANFAGTDGAALVDYHFVELTSDNVTSAGNAAATATLADPTPATPGILKSELAAASNGADLLADSESGTLQFQLQLSTDLTGFTVPAGHDPAVTITDSALFDGDISDASTSISDFDSLRSFAEMDAARFQASLESVISALNEVDSSSLLNADIALTNGRTLNELIDVSDIFTQQVLAGLVQPGALELSVSEDVAAWAAITDGSLSITVDGEVITLHNVDFSSVTNMNDVASILEAAINAATTNVTDVTVVFDFLTQRTDNDGNTSNVHTLTITSSGITSAATVTSPAVVIVQNDNGDDEIVGTSLIGEFAGHVVDAEGAVVYASRPVYDNAQQFRDTLRTLTNGQIADVVFVPASGASPAALRFDVSIDETLDVVRTSLRLPDAGNDLSHLTTQSTVDLTPRLQLSTTIDVELAPVGGDFVLTTATTLAAVNAGRGIRLNRDRDAADPSADGETDVLVNLRDTTNFEVNFDGAVTVGDIIDRYNNHADNTGGLGPGGRKLTVGIASDQQSLSVTDHTVENLNPGEDESTIFSIKPINGSLASYGLGLAGNAAAEDDDNTANVNEATTIQGAALHGLTAADHILMTDLSIQPSVALLAQDLAATAQHGFVEIDLTQDSSSNHSAVSGMFGQVLSYGSTPVSAGALIDDLTGDVELGSSTVSADVELHLAAAVNGRIADDVNMNDATVTGTVHVADGTSQNDYATNGATTSVTLNDAEELEDLASASFIDIVSSLDDLGNLISELMKLDALDLELPLLGISVSELASIGEEIGAIAESLASNPSTSLQQVEELIEDALGLADIPGVPVFALPELNTAAGRSYLNRVPEHFQPARLAAGDPVSQTLRTLDYLATQQHDSPEVGLAIDRSLVTRNVSDYSAADLQALLDQHGITLPDGATTFEVPGFTLRLDLAIDFAASDSKFAARLDADSDTAGVQVPLHFALEDFGLNLPSVIDVSGESMITIDVGTTLQLSMGLDLTDPNGITPFVYEYDADTQTGTTILASVTALADDISFRASIGPFGASIDGGNLALTSSDPFSDDFDAGNTPAAEFRLDLVAGDNVGNADGRLTIAEALAADASDLVATNVAAFAFADLPAFFPTADSHLGDFQLAADLSALTSYFADSSGHNTNSHPNGLSVSVTDSSNQPVFTASMPQFESFDLSENLFALVGGWEGVFDIVIDAMQGEVLGIHIPLIGDALADEARWLEDIRDTVVDTFGAADGSNPTLHMVADVLYSALGPDGVDLLTDANEDEVVTVEDIGLELTTGTGSIVTGVLFHLPLGRNDELLSESIAFDLGVPGLGLEVDGDVRLEADFRLDLGIGLSIDDGVYIDTSADNELQLSIEATIPGLTAKGTLGFLQLNVSDDAENPSHVGASFTVDLRDVEDGDGNIDDKLTLSEMFTAHPTDILSATVEAGADVNLDLIASFGGDADFPRLRSDFLFDWEFSRTFGTGADAADPGAAAPTLRFDNVGLSLGEFINQFVSPIVEQARKVTEPIQPILDALNSEVPVVSQILAGATWLDLAEMFGGAEVKPFVEALEILDQVTDVVDRLNGTGNDIWIELGSFTVFGEDAINPDMAGQLGIGSSSNPAVELADQLIDKGAAAFNDLLNDATRDVISFPLLEHPTNAFQLLLGHDVDLVVFDLPELTMGFNMAYRMVFPPFPILYAELGGGVQSTINFDFGYDTAGLRKFSSTLNPLDIVEGFYISDRASANGTGADIPEAAFTGYIYVQGGLDAGIFQAGVRGQLSATVDFNLHDYPDEFSNQTDGKVRADELIRSLKLSPPPIHIFDIDGSIDAALSAFLKIDLGLFTVSKKFKIASVRLLDFGVPRPAEDRPLLATKNGDTLTLNMTDAADHYVVLPGTDPNDSNRVVVRGFRPDGSVIDTRGFAGITQIVGLGSAGADIVEIDTRLQQTVELHGGDGNDRFTAGSGRTKFYGGAGDDVLIGGSANDVLDGGDGDDQLLDLQGHNTLRGGAGDDHLTAGKGRDLIEGGDGDDTIFAGAGHDEVHGGSGNDTIHGEDGNDRLFGDAGDDLILGANGRDWLDGGADNDHLYGGMLADTLIGGSGDDYIDGGVANDLIYGNAIGTLQLATGFFNDIGSGNNTIIAGSGSDRVSTGTGNDHVYAGLLAATADSLSNVIHTAGGDNVIVGDAGANSIVSGPGADTITTLGADDLIISGAGDDLINSGDGNDLVVAGFGDDDITTISGRNIVWGGLLPQTLSGIDPTSTILAQKLPQVVSAFDGSLRATVTAWAFDGVVPTDWTAAEAANPTGFDVPAIMPRGTNGLSVEGTPLDGNDTISTGDGDDVIFGGSDQDLIHGGDGNDFVDAGAGNDDVFGGDGRDVLLGGANNDRVFGNAGIDQVYGGFGDDSLFAGAGETIPVNGLSQDSLAGQRTWGGDGVDYLYAYAQVGNDAPEGFIALETSLPGDEMHGGRGGDFLFGNLRAEILSGGDGNDTILGDWLAGPETPAGAEDGLPFENTHKATVGGNDLLLGGSGEDTLTGGGGDDDLYGGADSDRLEGQDGVDSLFGGDWIDLLVLDVSPHYVVNGSADNVDGHGPAAPSEFTTDDNATDILVIEGDADRLPGNIDSTNDTIQVGQDGSGQLIVLYNGRVIEARWLDAFAKPLVEQFQLDGLTGNDHLEFLTAPVTVTGPDNQPLVVRPLDVSRLADRSDFVGVLNGGPGDDILRGTAVRDRIDGSSGSDTLFGFAGDDRLFGGSDGSANDHDVMYAGQGNDDLIGGSGSNEIFAWTIDPKSGAQFGLFVNANGELVTDNGDLDGDGFLDADNVSRPLQPENTGLNRMLGNLYEDDLYGGTGLDFIFGNGGNDRTFRADGTLFSSTDQDLGGDSWVQYARENSGVWYVGGSAREDIIQLNYVTEEGLLSGRHVVTRSTTIVDQNGVPRTTFDVSANLNFGATDADGNLIWDASRRAWDSTTDSFADDSISLSNLLPAEGVVQAVIIDALGGDDTVIVGETVQATVWVSAGAGNDYVEIKSGNALLPDETEAGSRNDSLGTAFELVRPELPAVLTAGMAAPAGGVLDTESNFTVKINDNAPIAVKVTQAAIHGIDGSYANENIDDLLFDINAALQTAGLQNAVTATRQGDRILFVSTDRGDDATLRIRAAADDPIVRQLGIVSDFVASGTSSTSDFTYNELTIDGIYDKDFYRIHLSEETGDNASVTVNSATLEDGLTVSLYQAVDGTEPRLIAVNADAWDRDGQANDSALTARVLDNVQDLLGIQGLTLTTANDVDYFTFTTDSVGRLTDRISIRQIDGDASLTVSLTDAAGNSIESTIQDGSSDLVHEFSLEGVAAGIFTLRISSTAAARYELIPSIGTVGTRIENLNTGAASSVSLASLDAGTYFIEVATPNALPTVYNMSFDLDLPGAISVPAIGLADTSFHVDRRDVVTGGDGHDVLIGGLGEDWIFGGDGNDVLSGGLDQQASDLLFGGAGSDTFQLLPDQLPNLHGSNQTFVPTFNDRFDGGDGEDRILYLGGDYTTNPITGASVAIPDYVSMRFNTQLHRYEFTSLQWDVANERFAVAEDGSYQQHYAFFQATNIEATVIDGQAGDDVVRADGEYKFPNTDSEWGIKRGNAQQGGTLGALTIEGGDGDDVLFGGDLNDIIDGGSGNDIIVGGLGDDLLFGGGGNDHLAGQHAGDQTPTFLDDDIVVPQFMNPNDLPLMLHVPAYRQLPIATTGLQNQTADAATVQDTDADLANATALNLTDSNEFITGVSPVGDLNADGFDDFVVSTNRMHYVFFGPVDLTSLAEIAARSAVDPHNITSRADVLIDASVGNLVRGIANVNGDYTGGASVQAVNDLVFVKQIGNTATINVLFGGASIRDGEADTFWPRSIQEFSSLDSFNWRSVNVVLPTANVATVQLLNYSRSDATDVMLVAANESSVMLATVVSGAAITGWDTQGSVNGTTVEPTTTFHLSVPDQTAASIQTVGDINGDGLDDVAGVIAARPAIGEAGKVYIHYARTDAPISVDLSAGYDRLLTDDYLAGSLTAAGDLNNDGYDDILLQRLQFDPATVEGGSSSTGSAHSGDTDTQNQQLNVPLFAGNLRGQVEEAPSLTPDHQLTVQMWVRVDRFANHWMPVFIKDSNGHTSSRTATIWINRDGYFHFTSAAAGHDQNYMNVYPAEGHIQLGEWYHISGTVDRISGVQSFYINGQLVQTHSVVTGTIVKSTRGLRIGNTLEGHGDFTAFHGAIADVRYFGRALPAEEIAAEYNSTTITDETDLIAWYRMQEDSGDRLVDSSNNANHGVYRSGGKGADRTIIEPTRSVIPALESVRVVGSESDPSTGDGGFGDDQSKTPAAANPSDRLVVVYGEADNVVDFQGQKLAEFSDNNYAEIPHTEDLVPTRQTTLSAWIYVDEQSNGWTPVVWKSDGTVTTASYSLWYHSHGFFQFTSTADGTTRQDYIQQADGSIEKNRWYHVAGVVNRDDRTISLYVDGKLVQTKTSIHAGDNHASTAPVFVGATPPNTNTGFTTFAGVISNLRLRNRALTAAEVEADRLQFATASADSSVVLELPLTNPTGRTLTDTSGNGHDAYFRHAENHALPTDDFVPVATRIDRTYPGIVAQDTPTVQLDASTLDGRTEFTVELQFKTPAANATVQTLLSSANEFSDNEFTVFLHPDGNIEVVDQGVSTFWQMPFNAADDQWHHLTLIRRASDVTAFVGSGQPLTLVTEHSAANGIDTSEVVRGKVIRIEKRFVDENILHLAEVVIRDSDGVNVAILGTATQSTTRNGSGGNVASKANDGDTNGSWNHGSVTHTAPNQTDSPAWWQVELPEEIDISSIEIFNRTDGAQSRLGNTRISVLDANGNFVWGQDLDSVRHNLLSIYDRESTNENLSILAVDEGTSVVRNVEVTVDADARGWQTFLTAADGHIVALEIVPGTINRLRPVNQNFRGTEASGDWALTARSADANSPIVIGDWNLLLETTPTEQASDWVRTSTSSLTVAELQDEAGEALPINGVNFDVSILDFQGERNWSATITSPAGTVASIGNHSNGVLSDFNGENPNGSWTLSVDTGNDATSIKPLLLLWEIEVVTSGSEILLDGHSLGTQATPNHRQANPDSAEPAKAIAATARHIRLAATSPGQILQLADVSVLDARGRHIAVFGTASQSGTNAAVAGLAIDTGAAYAGSTAIAEADENGNAWWLLDFGRDVAISDIMVTLPADHDGSDVSIIATLTMEDGKVTFRDTVDVFKQGLATKIYKHSGQITSFQNLDIQNPTVIRSDRNVDYAGTSSNFAGTGYNTRYAGLWTGQIRIDQPGDVQFFLTSDDGSRLFIDGQLVVNNPGLHGMQERNGTLNLEAGDHDVRIEFFNNDGPGGLIFSYRLPGESKVIVPASVLSTYTPSLFGDAVQQVRTSTVSVDNVDGSVQHLEVLANVDGRDYRASLLSPSGILLPLTLVSGSHVRYTTIDALPAEAAADGLWTLVVEPTSLLSEIEIYEFNLQLATQDLGTLQIQVHSVEALNQLPDDTLKPLMVSDGGLILGQDQDRVSDGLKANQSFIGLIDNVRIWDAALPSEDAANLANRPLNMIEDTNGLIAAWQFNEVAGSTFVDSSGNGHAASTAAEGLRRVRSAATPYVSTAPQVLTLADQAVRLPYQALDGQAEFTLELQIRFDPDELTTENVFFSAAGSRSYNEFTFWMEADGRLLLTDSGTQYYWNLQQPITDGAWHDLSVVRHSVNNQVMVDLYIDGRFQGRRHVANHALRVSSHGIVLGQDQDSIGWSFQSSQAFHGDLDNIRIWQAVRTPEQIVAGLGGRISDPQFEETLAGYWTFNGLDASGFKDQSGSRRDAVNYSGHYEATRSTGGLGTNPKSNSAESLDRTHHLLLTLANDISVVGTPLLGDVNGDGHKDLLLHTTSTADPNSLLLINNVADWNANLQVAVDNAQVNRILASGQAIFDVHTITDINADGFADVLLTTNDGARLPVLFGQADQVRLPKNFDVIANRSVTGSGDFVVDKGEAEQFDFEFTADDVQPDGSSLRWVRFTTLGDGYASETSDIKAGTWLRLSPNVRADLIAADGAVVSRNVWTLDLSSLSAGTYFLKVTSFAATEAAQFAITMRAPLAGTSWQPSDRDQIYAGEGDDWISGGAFKDIIFGNGADHAIDTVIGEPIEFRDPDSVTIPARTITVGGQQIELPAETILLEDRTNPAASENSTIPAGSRNPVLHLSDLTPEQLTMLGNTNFALTLGAEGNLLTSGTVRDATLQNAERQARSIAGRIFNDIDNNGVRSADESWLNDMNVTLIDDAGQFVASVNTSDIDLNGDGIIDPETEQGWYSFAGLEIGNYRIAKTSQVGWAQTSPAAYGIATSVSVTIDGIQSGSVDFGVRTLTPGKITGLLFNDANADGVQDDAETQLSGWQVSLVDAAGNRVAQTTTNDAGSYEFDNLVPGNYYVVREFRDGWGPDAGQWEVLRELVMGRLGIILDPAVAAVWDMSSPLILPSRTGLWYAVTPDGRLLQGTNREDAATGSLVRNIAPLMDSGQTMSENMFQMANMFMAAARNVTVHEGLPTLVDLSSRELQPGRVQGAIFNDANGNAVQDGDEVPRANVTVQLLNSDGSVAYSTTTNNIGEYSFNDVTVGAYYVSVTPEAGWRQTLPTIDPVTHAAWDLDQEVRLQHTGKYFENWGGLGEKWLYGADGWYYITPDGSVYEWNNSPLDDLSGRYVVTLNPLFHQNPEMLFEAIPPGATQVRVSENETTTPPTFLVTERPTASVVGSVFHDADGNGQRSSGELVLEGGTVDLLNTDGEIIETVFAGPEDVNGNNQIDEDERGRYHFSDVPVGDYFVRINPTTDWAVTTPAELDAQHEALRLATTYQLQLASSSLFDSRDRQEKWLTGIGIDQQAAMFFILSTGEVIQWDNVSTGILSGATVGRVAPRFYETPSLLVTPLPINAARIRIDESGYVSGPKFGLTPSDESEIDTLMSVWDEYPED